MKTLAYVVAMLALVASLPAAAQNSTGTGSGLPHQPGDAQRALALRNGQVTIEQLGSAAYSTPQDSGPLGTPPAAVAIVPNPALNSGAGTNECRTADTRGNCLDWQVGR